MNIKDTEKVDLITRARPNKSTLLEKYEIPIEHLSFEYITECTKGKELERILCILRSGEEGIYPELTRHTEKRLKILKPNSKLLTYSEPALTPNMLLPEDRKIIDEDLTDWIKEMQSRDKDLHEGKNNLVGNPDTIPDIRQVDPETSKVFTVRDKWPVLFSCSLVLVR
ncbi:sperm-associated antigen 1-like isoform X2 [Prorops nasuta]|uniref:sperm-associated antigen 1-like isoform X2 n=1 Tax=Prorops nasuta TaxID=863751 RepID=UPI0034CF2D90